MSSLEEEAKKRRERLALLKQKRASSATGEDFDSKTRSEEPDNKKPAFRSYKPLSEQLTTAEQKERAKPAAVEPVIADSLDRAKTGMIVDEVDLTALAPRKIDWDLKRDVSKRLEKLDRRTQRAIADLIRARLFSADKERGVELLASAVNSSSRAAEAAHVSDSDSD